MHKYCYFKICLYLRFTGTLPEARYFNSNNKTLNSTYSKAQKALTDSNISILDNADDFKDPIDTDDYDLEGHFNG